jgi:hypothetical protein
MKAIPDDAISVFDRVSFNNVVFDWQRIPHRLLLHRFVIGLPSRASPKPLFSLVIWNHRRRKCLKKIYGSFLFQWFPARRDMLKRTERFHHLVYEISAKESARQSGSVTFSNSPLARDLLKKARIGGGFRD